MSTAELQSTMSVISSIYSEQHSSMSSTNHSAYTSSRAGHSTHTEKVKSSCFKQFHVHHVTGHRTLCLIGCGSMATRKSDRIRKKNYFYGFECEADRDISSGTRWKRFVDDSVRYSYDLLCCKLYGQQKVRRT